MASKTGRPIGRGANDRLTLDRVLEIMKAEPNVSAREAIIRVEGRIQEAIIRRIHRKLKGMRDHDPRVILADMEAYPPPRKGREWSQEVPIAVADDGREWTVVHSCGPIGPVIDVVIDGGMRGDEGDFERPDLPITNAIDALGLLQKRVNVSDS